MEIIHTLARRMPHVQFHVIGGTERDLARWRQEGPCPNLLLHGYVPHGHVAHQMGAFRIALAPYQEHVSVSGGGDAAKWMSPLKLFEYMAHGKAIVASDLPVIREVIQSPRTGLLCPPGSPDAWVAAIQLLLDNPAMARDMGNRARQALQNGYTWVQRASRVIE